MKDWSSYHQTMTRTRAAPAEPSPGWRNAGQRLRWRHVLITFSLVAGIVGSRTEIGRNPDAPALTVADGGVVAIAALDAEVTRATLAIDDIKVGRFTADTPIFPTSSKGPREAPYVGFVRAGIPVSDHAALDEGSHRVIGVPFPSVDSAGAFRQGAQFGYDYPLYVYVPAHATGVVVPELAGAQRVIYGLYRELSVSPGEPGFAFVRCGKVRVLESRGEYLRVAAEYDAGELHGWIEAPVPGVYDEACDRMALTSHSTRDWSSKTILPNGYERVNDQITTPDLLSLVSKRKTVFLPRKTADGFVCEGWQFEPSKNPRHGHLVLDQADRSPELDRVWSPYGIAGSTMTIISPVRRDRKGGVTAGSCFSSFLVVRAFPNRLLVIKGYTSKSHAPLIGFRQSTVQIWHFDRAACERSLSKRPPPPGSVCCDSE
jgi:hypothetical protein